MNKKEIQKERREIVFRNKNKKNLGVKKSRGNK